MSGGLLLAIIFIGWWFFGSDRPMSDSEKLDQINRTIEQNGKNYNR